MWTDDLKNLIQKIYDGDSGQIGRIEIFPPDYRVSTRMVVTKASIKVDGLSFNDVEEAVQSYITKVEDAS